MLAEGRNPTIEFQRRISAMPTRRHMLLTSAAGLLCAGTSILPRAFAQATAPTIKKPVRVIVGFPAGGGTDVIARILTDRLRGPYASTVLVENKPGARRALRSNTSRTRNRTEA